MITFAWRTVFDPDEERELGDMLAEAAEADAEAGFPQVSLDQPYGRGASHLLVWLLADDRPGSQAFGEPSLAAYLRVEPDPGGGPATARYVVRPAFRSRGISTLLAERLGLDLAGAGWAGTEVPALRVWALGDHPAAQRMALRFGRAGLRPSRRRWQLIAPLRASGMPGAAASPAPGGPDAHPPTGPQEQADATALWRDGGAGDSSATAEVAVTGAAGDPPATAEVSVTGAGPDITGAVWFDPQAGERTGYGVAGRILGVRVRPGPGDARQTRAALLRAALAGLREHGLRVAVITVDAGDEDLARSCRLLGFMHDQTDTEYTLSAPDGVLAGNGTPGKEHR